MNRKAAKRKLLAGIEVKDNGCWIWIRGKIPEGYGSIYIEGKIWLTHRLSYFLFNNGIPKGKQVCHNCPGGDNPICCNPDHLFTGTSAENTADRHRKGRDAAGQRNGNSKLTDEQVIEIRKEYKGRYGQLKRLSEKHRVSVDQIRNIVRGKQRMGGVQNVNWRTTRLLWNDPDFEPGKKRSKLTHEGKT